MKIGTREALALESMVMMEGRRDLLVKLWRPALLASLERKGLIAILPGARLLKLTPAGREAAPKPRAP